MPPLPASHWWYRIATNLMPSIAVLFLFLFSNTGNQLSTPWVTINTLSTVTGDGLSQNQTVLVQVESRSLNSLPIVYQCLGVNGVCTRNATGIALDPLDLGISEAVNRRLCLSLLLGSLAASLCSIVAALMFQFHSCRVDGEGRPLPHVHKLCISNRQVGKVLLVALMSSALTATLSNVATRLYYESITAPFMDALPPPLHTVATGVGYEVVVRTTNFGWGAFLLLSLSYFLGPMRWREAPPQALPGDGDEDEVRDWGGGQVGLGGQACHHQ